MVHTVSIRAYHPAGSSPGRITFLLAGTVYNAKCYADPQLADGLLVPGTEYPIALTMEADGKVEYVDPATQKLEVIASHETGDRVRAVGRTWDSVGHQVIKLDANPSVGVRLNLPQTATDYRGGSWLMASGVLTADLPPEEHD